MAILGRADKTPLGIYIHIPFCRSKCKYCDFYSLPEKNDKLMKLYLWTICTHIQESGNLAPGYRVDTIYFRRRYAQLFRRTGHDQNPEHHPQVFRCG